MSSERKNALGGVVTTGRLILLEESGIPTNVGSKRACPPPKLRERYVVAAAM